MKIKFCPYCGSKEKLRDETISCKNCGMRFHINNTPSAGALIIKGEKVLLAKRAIAPKKGYYDFPGGFIGFGEHPQDAIKREIFEETGLKIELIDLLGIYINKDYKYQNETIFPQDTVYIAKIKSGKPVAKDDVEELKWFPVDKPPDKIAFSSVGLALDDLKKWLKGKKVLS